MSVTDFERKIYRIVSQIPRGYVSTYKLVARKAGCGSCRAVGQALKRNPYAPRVPCHRVIASDLDIGGFCGSLRGRQIQRKVKLLRREGVLFEKGKLTDPSRVYDLMG